MNVKPPSESTLRKIIIGASTSALAAIMLAAFWYVPEIIADAHDEEHEADKQARLEQREELKQVESIAKSNAAFINDQILVNLYLRLDDVKEQREANPHDGSLQRRIAEIEREIRRREGGSRSDVMPDL